MTLIRHNVRNTHQPGHFPGHFVHDTTVTDTSGCRVSGRPGLVFTSYAKPCPQCGGWGELVPIVQLERKRYPQGTEVPERYRVTGAVAPDQPVKVATPDPAPVAPDTVTQDAAATAMGAMLAAMVPEVASIRETIAEAVAEVKAEASADIVEQLTERFEETVARLVVPTTVVVDHGNGTAPVPVTGNVHTVFAECLEWLQARDAEGRPRNLYLTGPAGCGKTTLAKQLAQALDVPFYTTGQVLSEHQVTGFVDAGGSYHTTPFRQAFEHGGVWLGDEWDAWSPEATLAANAALANGHAAFPDSPEPISAHRDFYVIAAANTWGHGADREYVGRNEMDAASISRFVTVPVDYDRSLESQIAGQYSEWLRLVWKVRDNAREHRIRMTVGTRELVHGVAALSAGITQDRVTQRVLRRDLSENDWSRVTA